MLRRYPVSVRSLNELRASGSSLRIEPPAGSLGRSHPRYFVSPILLGVDKAKLLDFACVLEVVVERSEEAMTSPEGLNYPKAKRRCKATNSRAMGLAAPWYRKGGTSVESSIPYSHGGRALVVKGAEEVENTEANSKN
ncbi:hypothetical protein BHM03_00056662 [Ensete ventricosum]|nr:hypothetical protein BHM03_00056662 [Ensete ventricosum]